MARPFRFQPPSLPHRALRRPRLLQLLARRWDHRLTTVVAGPGFGKTALLVAAMQDTPSAPPGEDVWLSCESPDESPDHLLAGLNEAFGLGAGSQIDTILDSVWARAPTAVCFVLDDVHEIPAGSEGAALVERLVRDLPRNGHVVLASRATVPVPTARLAAGGELIRLREADLVLDEEELVAFAHARDVDPALLASTGGWPALAELTASAGADLVVDYLWEEVLTRVGVERARLLAYFAIAGGGDDEVASALAGHPTRVDDLVANVPLVERASTGWTALHPLWTPPLRNLLSETDADAARRTAAAVHRREGRLQDAIDLLAEAGAWEEMLAVIRDAATDLFSRFSATEFGRWYQMLPQRWRNEPAALLAAGLELQTGAPLESIPILEAATAGFRAADDVDGEIAAIAAHGVVLWWVNDPLRLLGLHERVVALAATGSDAAQFLAAVGLAAVAHLTGDSSGVFAALSGVDTRVLPGWLPVVQWFKSTAHRRDGDLDQALSALDAVEDMPGRWALRFEHARLRTEWLRGDVDHVCARLPGLRDRLAEEGDHFNASGVVLELIAKVAWLGEPDVAAGFGTGPGWVMPEMPGAMAVTMRLIADAALAVSRGDEVGAAQILRADTMAMIGQPDGWYWRDRAAIALVHMLVPETRAAWDKEPLGPPHRIGLELAMALEAVRNGDLSVAAELPWPEPGVVRAHLPLPWVVELVAAGLAAGNRPPGELLTALGPRLRPALQRLTGAPTTAAPVAAAAKSLLATLPAVPSYRLRMNVLGPLELLRDGETVIHADLRRQRVRELLCFLTARSRVRREEITDELWPELDDRGHNLRVTLNYLQRVLQPERAGADPPYFLRADGPWLALERADRLEVDAWELHDRLDEAAAAERANAPATALAAYRAALPLWRGEPYAEVPYAPWVQPERARLRDRYTSAAIRAGELLLAAGETTDAREAATRAIAAEPTSESAYRLMARAHLADDNLAGARRVIEECRATLAELDLEPEAATLAIMELSAR